MNIGPVELSLMGFGVFALILAGFVLFVIAIVRWEANSWKYVLLGAGIVLPMIAAVAGWIALFAGGTKRRTTPPGF